MFLISKGEKINRKGHTCNVSVERQFYNKTADSDIDLEFSEKLLVGTKRPPTTAQLADEITFVKRFKTNTGRINWAPSLKEAYENNLLLSY